MASVDNVIELCLLLVKPFQAYLFVLWEEAEVEEALFQDNESITGVYTRAAWDSCDKVADRSASQQHRAC